MVMLQAIEPFHRALRLLNLPTQLLALPIALIRDFPVSSSDAVLLPSCSILSPLLNRGRNEVSALLCNSVEERRGIRADLEMN